MNERTPNVRLGDISEEMQNDALSVATKAIGEHRMEKDIAAHIKKEFDKRHNPTWQCIAGRSFGADVVHESKHFIYFYVGQLSILLWKTGDRSQEADKCLRKYIGRMRKCSLGLSNAWTSSANLALLTTLILILTSVSSHILAGLREPGIAWKSVLPLLPTAQAVCHFAFSCTWLLMTRLYGRRESVRRPRARNSTARWSALHVNPLCLSLLAAGAYSMANVFIYTGVSSMDAVVFQCISTSDVLLVEILWLPDALRKRMPTRQRWMNTTLLYVACISLFLLKGVTYPLISVVGVISALATSLLLTGALLVAERAARLDHNAAVMSMAFSGGHAIFSFASSIYILHTPVSQQLDKCAKHIAPIMCLALLQGLRHVTLGALLRCRGAVSVVHLAALSAALSVALELPFPSLSLALFTLTLVAAYRRSKDW